MENDIFYLSIPNDWFRLIFCVTVSDDCFRWLFRMTVPDDYFGWLFRMSVSDDCSRWMFRMTVRDSTTDSYFSDQFVFPRPVPISTNHSADWSHEWLVFERPLPTGELWPWSLLILMPLTKPWALWKDLGLLVRTISIKDPLSDLKQVGSLTRFFKLKASNRSDKWFEVS